MLIVMLPGYSYNNREEMSDIKNSLQSANYEVYGHEWQHWHNPSKVFNPFYELSVIKEVLNDQDFALVTKSIGGYVGVKLIQSVEAMPEFGIFMGIGAKDLKTEERVEYYNTLKKSDFSKIFVHNSNDPHGDSTELKRMLKDLEYDFIEKQAENHKYKYPELVLEIVNKYTA